MRRLFKRLAPQQALIQLVVILAFFKTQEKFFSFWFEEQNAFNLVMNAHKSYVDRALCLQYGKYALKSS